MRSSKLIFKRLSCFKLDWPPIAITVNTEIATLLLKLVFRTLMKGFELISQLIMTIIT